MKPERVIIVGSGVAGCEVATSLAKSGEMQDIVLISNESGGLYDKTALSKAFLCGDKTASELISKSPVQLQQAGLYTLLGEAVVDIDAASNTLTLGNQQQLNYDKLVLATGGLPTPPGVDGEHYQNVHYLRTLVDATRLKNALTQVKRAVIVGGGFIGLEVAWALRKLGKEVMVLERTQRLLHRLNSRALSHYVEDVLVSSGAKFAYGKSAQCFTRVNDTLDGERRKHADVIICSDGTEYFADLFLVCVGMTPNIGLATQAGLNVDGGIVVNEFGQASIGQQYSDNIYAVGDCSVTFRSASGRYAGDQSIQAALQQARAAAAHILGAPAPARGVPTFWTEIAGKRIQMFGCTKKYDRMLVDGDTDAYSLTLFYCANDHIVAAHVFNHPQNLTFARGAVANQVSVAVVTEKIRGQAPTYAV